MKKSIVIFLFLSIGCIKANSNFDEEWYENPLGFNPINLHTRNAFLIPAIAVGVGLLLTDFDSTITERLSIFNESGVSLGYKYPYTTVVQNNTGISYKLRNWMSVGIDFDIYYARDGFNNVMGAALRPFARFYPIYNNDWKLYFESGAGFIYFTENFPKPTDRDPRLGTFWNGTTKYGIGAEFGIDNYTYILCGIRHIHVSNGNTKGVERNPSHDSNGFFIGFSRNISN